MKFFLTIGTLYEITGDLMESFPGEARAGALLVFLHQGHNHYDGTYGAAFYDIQLGKRVSFSERKEITLVNRLKKTLTFRGIEMVVEAVPTGGLEFSFRSDYRNLANEVDYLQSLVEGKPGIESWYTWMNRNRKTLSKSLTRPDFLRFIANGYTMASIVLSELGRKFNASPRYRWIGDDVPQKPILIA